MNRIATIGLTILAISVLTAAAAATTQASEGPFYKVNKNRLLKGENTEVEAKLATGTEYVLEMTGVTIACKKQKFTKGAVLVGSTGHNSGTSEETIVLEECKLTGFGEKCALTSPTITTVPLKDTLAYPKKVPAKGDILSVLFSPATGIILFNLNFEPEPGGKCIITSLVFEGSFAAEALEGKKEPFAIDVNEPETEIGYLRFPPKAEEACVEAEATVTCQKPKITTSGKSAKFKGTSELKLMSKQQWGVFSAGTKENEEKEQKEKEQKEKEEKEQEEKEGPFYKINGKRLLKGENTEVEAKLATGTEYVLEMTGVTIACKKQKFTKGAMLVGSTGHNSGTSEETIVLEECKLTGFGEKCALTSPTITTVPLKDTLAYPKKVRAKGDTLSTVFRPAMGTILFNLNFEPEPGGKCIITSLAFEGSFAAEALEGKKEPFAIEANELETEIGYLRLPPKAEEACVEAEKVVTCEKPKMTTSGKSAKFKGTSELKLISKQKWGVFSK
jgi:hypothetical protein